MNVLGRYNNPINDIFSEQQKLSYQLQVERELAYAHFKIGNINQDSWDEINKNCRSKYVKLARVQEIEKDTHHDLMSVILAISEQCPTSGGLIHLGATSMDVQDTVLGLQLKKAKEIILQSLDSVIANLRRLTEIHRYEMCIGRTHGQHALPMTHGFKFANFLSEFLIVKHQLIESQIDFGKFNGAIGTYASFQTQEIEKLILERLGLQRVPITTQIIPRIVYMPFLSAIISLVGTCERIAKEIRNLQRPEIAEWYEDFGKNQVGSSTMPHKLNPHKSERICGLARVIRSLYSSAAENIASEHERDLTNSAPERILFPNMLGLSNYILTQLTTILSYLKLDSKNIKRNLNLMGGRQMAEAIMMKLSYFIGRQKAHKLLAELSSNSDNFNKAVKSDLTIQKYLKHEEINSLLNPENYLGLIQEKIDLILESD